MKKILQLDGGGYKGRMTTFFLQALEEKLGKPLYQVFDLISGTSTGAIIAGCLAAGASASLIHSVYRDEGAKLFKRNWSFPVWAKTKYDRTALMNRIREIISYTNIDRMSGTKVRLQINAVNLVSDENVYFKSWKEEYLGMKISDAIQRSFSAAVYFGSTPVESENAVYADGGEGNSNCTLLECMIESAKLDWRKDGVFILSVGTGFTDNQETFKEASGYGLIGQTGEYMNMARRQAMRTQLECAWTEKSINPDFDFIRVDTEIDKKYDELDGLSYGNQYDMYGRAMVVEFLNDDLLKKLA